MAFRIKQYCATAEGKAENTQLLQFCALMLRLNLVHAKGEQVSQCPSQLCLP